MKECKGCKEEKPFSEFYDLNKNSDGKTGKCKECIKSQVRSNKSNYDNTEKGVIRVIYKAQVCSSKKRGHSPPEYTKNELALWLYGSGFKSLYDDWVESGYAKDKKPSVDRIDEFKGYSIGNIKLTTWYENRKRQYSDKKKGIGSSSHQCKRVGKINEKGDLICEYVSYSSASRDSGYSIEYAIKNKTKCKKGYFWEYL